MNQENFDTVFNVFLGSNSSDSILNSFEKMLKNAQIDPTNVFTNGYKMSSQENTRLIYKIIKSKKNYWRSNDLFKLYDKKIESIEYRNPGRHLNVLIIGCGPVGLRLSIECALLGFKCTIIEKRPNFSRNNIIHLWQYSIHDLKSLGAKFFYGKFCVGSIDHISLQKLQCILLKTALLLGVQVCFNTSFEKIVEPGQGWGVKCSPDYHPINHEYFDAIIGANGKKVCLPGFEKKQSKNKLSIGITANFINYNTRQEAETKEISGYSYLYQKKFFDELNMGLENLVYYKEDTHYFVMTIKREFLSKVNVFKRNYSTASLLLSKNNILHDNLNNYVKKVAAFCQLPRLDFALNQNGQPDVAIFDFSSLGQAENSSRILNRKDKKVLLALVGDSLLEPFWPMGTGIGRGFLSAMDTAWQLKKFASNLNPVEVLYEREKFYQILSQTRNDNLPKNFAKFTIDPSTRYYTFSTKLSRTDVVKLYDNSKEALMDMNVSKIGLTPQQKRTNNFEQVGLKQCNEEIVSVKRQKLNDDKENIPPTSTKFKRNFFKKLDYASKSTPIVARMEVVKENKCVEKAPSFICSKCKCFVVEVERLFLFNGVVFHVRCYNEQVIFESQSKIENFSPGVKKQFWQWFINPLTNDE